ncbi:MAG: nucleotidyltransferase domain-containing protein [Nanoarchaeota archaeon]
METTNTSNRILTILLKEPYITNTVSKLAEALKITRQGLWKILKKLHQNKLILLESIGNKKTSTIILKLNWNNSLLEKTLSLSLARDALSYERWIVNFKELEGKVDFLILFGSILTNPKEANDIDIIAVINKKENFKEVENIIINVQKTLIKKIHIIDMTKTEFSQELKKSNPAYLDALKKGVILYGQDKFIEFVKGLKIG